MPVNALCGPISRRALEAVRATGLKATVCKRRREGFRAQFEDRLEDSPTVFTATRRTGRERRLKPLA